LKSAENMAAIAAKAGNDAYNIRSSHRRARVRDKAAGQNVIRPNFNSPDDRAGAGNGKVDSYGSDL